MTVISGLVTGSSSGIGKAITALLLKNGIKVIGLARDHSKFTPEQSNYFPVTVDLSDIVNIEKKIQAVLKEYPTIRIFISNAGYGDFRHLENFSTPQIQKFLDLNLISQIILSRNLTSHFKSNGGGDIIFLGSEAGLAGKKKSPLYSAAKFGLRGFAQA